MKARDFSGARDTDGSVAWAERLNAGIEPYQQLHVAGHNGGAGILRAPTLVDRTRGMSFRAPSSVDIGGSHSQLAAMRDHRVPRNCDVQADDDKPIETREGYSVNETTIALVVVGLSFSMIGAIVMFGQLVSLVASWTIFLRQALGYP